MTTPTAAARPRFREVLREPRMVAVLALGLASGLPYNLTDGTLQAWLKDYGVSNTQIGLLTLVGLPYAWKFLWAPLIDRYSLPFIGRLAEDNSLRGLLGIVSEALEESENAFSDYGKRQQRLVSLIRQSESSRTAADLAAIRYREGTVDFLVLLDAQRERLAAEDSQAQAEVELYRGVVAIYKALGGGWQAETVASAR